MVVLLGSREPRLSLIPDGDDTRGNAAVRFARDCGMTLFPWQEDLLRDLCKVDPETGRWAAREAVISVARQNGKGEVLVARELAGIFLFGEKTILHTAHLMDTAVDAQKRLFHFIETNRKLMHWWDRAKDLPVWAPTRPAMSKTNGKENITFPNGAQVVFRTRTVKTGRGLSIDYLIIDECFNLPNEINSAISKTVRARKHAQTVFISSPVNRYEHMHGAVFSAKRWAAIDGKKRTLFKEWSPAEGDDPFSPETWAKCNPSMVDDGVGAQLMDIESEAESAKTSEVLRESFLIETLGQGNWYPRDGEDVEREYVLDREKWEQSTVAEPAVIGDNTCMGLAVAPGGAAVGMVLAYRTVGGVHLSLAPLDEFDRAEIVSATKKTVDAMDPLGVVMDPKGPSSTVIDPLEKAGIEPECLSWVKVVAATELLLTLNAEGTLTHDADPRWAEAIDAAEFRSGVDKGRALREARPVVCVLVAAAFAAWGLTEFEIPDEAPAGAHKTKYVGRPEIIRAPEAMTASATMSF